MVEFFKKILIDQTEDKNIVFLRYIFYGGIVSVINILLLYLFVEFLNFNYVIADIFSMIICIIITYILSKKFIFSKKVSIGVKKEFISYIIIAIISIVIDTAVLSFFSNILSVYYLVSKVIAIIISTGVNYYLKQIVYERYKL